MNIVVEGDGTLEIRDRMPPLKRGILLGLSLVPWMAPYELLVVPKWQHYWNPFFLFAAVISAGAVCVSALLVWGALAGLSSAMRFSRLQNTFSYTAHAPIVPLRHHRCPLSSIRMVEIEVHNWSEGSPTYSLKVLMQGGREFTTGASWSQEEAQKARERVLLFLRQSG
ncbi:MAG: hypothetical protein AB1898_18695 [Acidobacteriota bacterium]